jgi:hypothetical protein
MENILEYLFELRKRLFFEGKNYYFKVSFSALFLNVIIVAIKWK